jgi:hypothetical protein
VPSSNHLIETLPVEGGVLDLGVGLEPVDALAVLAPELPEITRQSLMIGNRIGQEVALELQQEMTNELRNRGHKL